MVGYLGALPILLTGGAGAIARLMSLIPPFSPFAMLARLMVGQVPPWEVALSLGLLVLAIVAVAVAAIRIYSAGVLLYGQRPGIRDFVRRGVGEGEPRTTRISHRREGLPLEIDEFLSGSPISLSWLSRDCVCCGAAKR